MVKKKRARMPGQDSFKEETMIINHNMSAIFAQTRLKQNVLSTDKAQEKLSSGLRIFRAGDDASGLAVSEKMRSQIRGLHQAELNAENGVSFIQVAEGYLQESQDVLQRIRELSVQASNGIYSDEDRMQIQVEISQLIDEIDRVASHAQFNGMNMLTGRFARMSGENVVTSSMWFHIGANMDQRERVAIGVVDTALKAISKQRADLGAYQNRLEHAARGLAVGAENMQASESRIRDADMAKEMVEFVKDSILVQSATAMLAQANTRPQVVLRLLG
jgi:flagellin